MAKDNVLIEIPRNLPRAFSNFELTRSDSIESNNVVDNLLGNLTGFGITVNEQVPPVPMFTTSTNRLHEQSLRSFSTKETNDDLRSETLVVACEMDRNFVKQLHEKRPDIKVWPNSKVELFRTDCQPFKPAVSIATIQTALGVQSIWNKGFEGQNVVVGIVDEGVNNYYPVIGGYSQTNARRAPGTAPITSHGSMCAADVLVAAPKAKLYDYPFLGVPNSGGVLVMMQAILNQRRLDGTPHIVSNSYNYVFVPSLLDQPDHEIYNLDHPVNRKIKEVAISGAHLFFSAGNCGGNCASGKCDVSSIGPGKSIHASNSLSEVITVAAVNSLNDRLGYSGQGPGMFAKQKPDIACYSHFFGNFGAGRPAGTARPFDDGTSAATPLAAGVAALLINAYGPITPAALKTALFSTTVARPASGFDYDLGYGVINAWNAFQQLA